MGDYTTPDYFHCLQEARFREAVYEPEADTFLLLEALDQDAELLRQLSPAYCCEIGCGSGTVITHLAMLLCSQGEQERPSCVAQCVAVDVNPIALEATAMTWERTMRSRFAPTAHVHTMQGGTALVDAAHRCTACAQSGSTHAGALVTVEGDLFEPLSSSGVLFDVIVHNPPYVPTSMEELETAINKRSIEAAWCGGPGGRVVLDRFIHQLPQFLSPCGSCYIVLIRENDVHDVTDLIQSSFYAHHHTGEKIPLIEASKMMVVEKIAQRYTGEHLCIIRVRYQESACVANNR